MKYLLISLFILGALFSNASHIPVWFLGGERPTHSHWKLYGLIALVIWLLIFYLANTAL